MTFSRTFSKSTMSLIRDIAAAGKAAPQARPRARAAERQGLKRVFMDNLAPDEAGEQLTRMPPCQLRANYAEKIPLIFPMLISALRPAAGRRARTAEH